MNTFNFVYLINLYGLLDKYSSFCRTRYLFRHYTLPHPSSPTVLVYAEGHEHRDEAITLLVEPLLLRA